MDVCSRNGPSSEGIGIEACALVRRRLLEALVNSPGVPCPSSFGCKDPRSVLVLMLTICRSAVQSKDLGSLESVRYLADG